jgi:hypothetical protein
MGETMKTTHIKVNLCSLIGAIGVAIDAISKSATSVDDANENRDTLCISERRRTEWIAIWEWMIRGVE